MRTISRVFDDDVIDVRCVCDCPACARGRGVHLPISRHKALCRLPCPLGVAVALVPREVASGSASRRVPLSSDAFLSRLRHSPAAGPIAPHSRHIYALPPRRLIALLIMLSSTGLPPPRSCRT